MHLEASPTVAIESSAYDCCAFIRQLPPAMLAGLIKTTYEHHGDQTVVDSGATGR
jgi:hypothetical protein